MRHNHLKLDNIDIKLLSELDKNAKTPITQLAKKLRVSREIVKYRLKRLIDTRVIKSFTTMVNPAKFGYIIYKLYIKFQNLIDTKEKELFQFLIGHKKVFWLARCDGNYDLIIGVYVLNIVEFNDFLSEFNGKYSSNVISRHISNSVYVDIYRKDYLTNEKYQTAFWGGIPKDEEIDDLSKKILKVIAENSRIHISEICEKVNSTPKTIISKIKLMEKKQIILGYRPILDLSKIKKENFKAIIYFQNISPDKEKQFKDFCKLNPSICYYIKTIGEWDVELDIEIDNFKEYNLLIRMIKEQFGNIIKNIDSVYLTKELKGELNIVQNL